MLSYRHAFLAGNFADVHKHIVLSLLVESLLHKDAPFCYLDSHAATGRYDLHSTEAQKNAEYRQGIHRLWRQDNIPDAVRPYLSAVQALNSPEDTAVPRYYPGSPRIVRHFLRPQDRMILTELHPADFQRLQQEFTADRQVAVHHLDGYQGLTAFLPPQERRGLVLIDPAFERRDETAHIISALQNACKRWAHGVYALWFPITNRSALDGFYQKLKKTGIRKILSCELCIRPPLTARQLNGSLMVIINPPWQTDTTLRTIQPWLATILADNGHASHNVEWLVGE
jgi:23S rRNA (adenine2030-N6)-methyltransferase